MADCKIILYTSKTLKNAKHPIVLRVTHQRKRKYYTLGEGNKGYAATPDYWDEITSRYRRNQPDYKALNKILLDIEQEAKDILYGLEGDKTEFSFAKFERKFKNTSTKDDLKTIFEEEIKRLNEAGRIGYSNTYKWTKMAILKYAGREDIKIHEIDYKFLVGFESSLLGNGDKKSTISVYMRTLRTLFNSSIKYDYIKEEHYPFASRTNPNGYSLGKLKVQSIPRAITREQLKKLECYDIPETSTKFHDRNFFMFSFYCRGINFHDMALLKWSNIETGRLIYTRAKTKGQFDIGLLEPAFKILAYYQNNYSSKYIFPILSDEMKEPLIIKNRIRNALKRNNKNLKDLAKELELPPLTSYVSRHSYASIMKFNGIAVEHISESMGHKNVAQTETYLKKFSSDVLDEANKSIL